MSVILVSPLIFVWVEKSWLRMGNRDVRFALRNWCWESSVVIGCEVGGSQRIIKKFLFAKSGV